MRGKCAICLCFLAVSIGNRVFFWVDRRARQRGFLPRVVEDMSEEEAAEADSAVHSGKNASNSLLQPCMIYNENTSNSLLQPCMIYDLTNQSRRASFQESWVKQDSPQTQPGVKLRERFQRFSPRRGTQDPSPVWSEEALGDPAGHVPKVGDTWGHSVEALMAPQPKPVPSPPRKPRIPASSDGSVSVAAGSPRARRLRNTVATGEARDPPPLPSAGFEHLIPGAVDQINPTCLVYGHSRSRQEGRCRRSLLQHAPPEIVPWFASWYRPLTRQVARRAKVASPREAHR
jgi:hypothetical protein